MSRGHDFILKKLALSQCAPSDSHTWEATLTAVIRFVSQQHCSPARVQTIAESRPGSGRPQPDLSPQCPVGPGPPSTVLLCFHSPLTLGFPGGSPGAGPGLVLCILPQVPHPELCPVCLGSWCRGLHTPAQSLSWPFPRTELCVSDLFVLIQLTT